MNKIGWYNISKVLRGTSKIIQSNIDSVFADSTGDALIKAAKRNGYKPWEEFGASRAVGMIGISQAVTRHDRRSIQIEELRELIEVHD